MASWFWGQAILIPTKKENVVLAATIISAALNIILNFILIPTWKGNAAAFTTLLAEGLAYLISRHEGVKIVKLEGIGKTILKVLLGCVGIVGVSVFLLGLKDRMAIYTVTTIVLSVIIYAIIEILLKNESVIGIWNKILAKFSRQR